MRYSSSNAFANNFQQDYIWVKGIVSNPNDPKDYGELELRSIEDFLAARKAKVPDLAWPGFKKRMEEMSDTNPNGSRSGDIVTILDGRAGYLAVNFKEDAFKGWHGGPTVSESYVPLIFGMPGESFSDDQANLLNDRAPVELSAGYSKGVRNLELEADGYLRNWHLTPILQGIITEFREE